MGKTKGTKKTKKKSKAKYVCELMIECNLTLDSPSSGQVMDLMRPLTNKFEKLAKKDGVDFEITCIGGIYPRLIEEEELPVIK